MQHNNKAKQSLKNMFSHFHILQFTCDQTYIQTG